MFLAVMSLSPTSMPDLRESSIWEREAMSIERRESSTVDCRLRAGGASVAPGSCGTCTTTHGCKSASNSMALEAPCTTDQLM